MLAPLVDKTLCNIQSVFKQNWPFLFLMVGRKRTPFYAKEAELGAKFVDFGGWDMPVMFTSIIEEHNNTRQNVSLFDISHMGEFVLEGEHALDFLQYMSVNDASLLTPGRAQYSNLCYENGTVVDDLFYYMCSPEKFKIIVNASNKEKDFDWLGQHAEAFEGVSITDQSMARCRFALQGPKAQDVLQRLVAEDLDTLARFRYMDSEIAGVPAFVARTGYTGEDGFEISFAVDCADDVWTAVLDAGSGFGLKLAGLGARDSLRLEAGYSLYGDELSDQITPVEAGIEFIIKKDKIPDYIGKEALLKQLEEGPSRKIVAMMATDKGILRHGQDVFNLDGTKIGYITSGTFCPTAKAAIALAMLDAGYWDVDTEVIVPIREKPVHAKVVSKPIYPYHPRS
jgi:aminomethyltransferase